MNEHVDLPDPITVHLCRHEARALVDLMDKLHISYAVSAEGMASLGIAARTLEYSDFAVAKIILQL